MTENTNLCSCSFFSNYIRKGSIIANASLVTKNTTGHSIVNKVVAALHEATEEGSLVLNDTKTYADNIISPDTPGFLNGNVRIYAVNDIIVLFYDMTLGGGGYQ